MLSDWEGGHMWSDVECVLSTELTLQFTNEHSWSQRGVGVCVNVAPDEAPCMVASASSLWMYECWLVFYSSLSDLRLGKCFVNTVGLFFFTCKLYTTAFTSASSAAVGIKPSGRLKRDFPLPQTCFLFLVGLYYDIIFFFPYHIPARSSFSWKPAHLSYWLHLIAVALVWKHTIISEKQENNMKKPQQQWITHFSSLWPKPLWSDHPIKSKTTCVGVHLMVKEIAFFGPSVGKFSVGILVLPYLQQCVLFFGTIQFVFHSFTF